MNSRSLITIAGTALVTATLALAALRPSFVHAVADTNPLSGIIQHPKLVGGGVEVTLSCLQEGACREGNEALFEVTAVNTTGDRASLALDFTMRIGRKPNPLSRAIAIPPIVWKEGKTLELRPHETRSLTLKGTILPANSQVEVLARLADAPETPQIRMLSFSTGGPPEPSIQSLLSR